jgi:hypothetical protein
MKTLISQILAALLCLISITSHAQNIEGQIIASQYGTWKVPGYAPNTYSNFAPTACRVQGGASFFSPFSVGTPIRIVDSDPSLSEIVTPVEVVENNNACSISIVPTHYHGLPFSITSATGGLQEAINANLSDPGTNTIILNNEWYNLGGSSSTISSVTGSAQLGLVDVTTTPFTWYQWDGSAYAKVSVGGGVPSVNGITAATSIAAGQNTSVSTAGSTITVSSTGGVPSLNGSTGAQTITGSGIVTVSTVGTNTTVSAAGGAGTGGVGSGALYQDTSYPASGTNVGPTANKFTLPTGLSSAQLTTYFAGALGNTTIQYGDGHLNGWTNTNSVGVDDERQDVPTADWNVKWSGAQCDLQGGFGSVTQGSPTLTFTEGYTATTADAGDPTTHAGAKFIEMVSQVSGVPTRFDATITAVDTMTNSVTLSTNAPFTASEYAVLVGHRDDAAIAAAFGKFTFSRPIAFPTGNCWSDTIAVFGQSFHGNGRNASLITGLAGDDVFATLDPTNEGFQGSSPDQQILDMKWELNALINAAQPWQDIGPTGTVTQHAATYRPTGIETVWANYPLGPGWIIGTGPNNTGAFNGVATTNGTTSITITSAAVPVAGQQLVFPYASTGVFVTTVSAVSGSTVTLANAYPPTGTLTQQEWMAGANPVSNPLIPSGTAIQKIETAIPSTLSFAPTVLAITATSKTGTVGTYTWSLTSGPSPSAGQPITITGTTNGSGIFNGTSTIATVSGETFTIDGFPSSTIPSQSESGSATASAIPFVVTLANPITPPLTPNSNGTGSNVAPYGLVQIGSEQFSYFGSSAYPANPTVAPSISLTGRAQNGTTAAAHAIGSPIVPLNPFQPTWPWPVAPTINDGVTPANAAFFPAWDIGNAGWSQPTFNGVDWNPNAGLSFANMHDITITIDDFLSGNGNPAECYQGCQNQNATAGMYIVALPFKTNFENIHIENPQFGIFEGQPSINTFGMFSASFPTADGSTWKNITIQSAGYDTFFIGGQSDTKRDFLTFCQNFGETGNSWPGLVNPGGCGAAWIWGSIYNDITGGSSGTNTHATLENWYVEPEAPPGGLQELQPYFEYNCTQCTYRINPFGGGVTFVDGVNNNYTGMQFNSSPVFPIVNYGYSTNMQWVESASEGGNSNTYGAGSFLNYGANASVMGLTDNQNGVWGNLASGNTIAPVFGQTAEALETGNDEAAYISSSSAIIYADQMPLAEGWTFDDTAPISHSYATCATSPGMGCASFQFSNNSRVLIGPDQKLVAGKYIAHYAFKTPNTSTTFFFQLASVGTGDIACPGGETVLNSQISTTGSWVQGSTPVDFSTSANCALQMTLVNSPVDASVEMAYLIFTPVWNNVVLPVTTPTEGAACSTPGAFIGSDASFIYVCASGGTIKRVGIS